MTRLYLSYRSQDAEIVQQIYNCAIETYGNRSVVLNPEDYMPHDVTQAGEFLERLGSYRTGQRMMGRWQVRHEPVEDPMEQELTLEDLIENLMGGCQAVVIVVGHAWSGVDEFGRFLLSSADVPVGLEIDIALRSGCQVIPVLVNGIRALPPPDELPENLHGLYDTRPVVLRPNHFYPDIRQLIETPSLLNRLRYWLTLAWLNQRVTGH